MKRMKKLLSLFLCVILIGCLFNINNVQAATVSLNKKSTSVYIGKTTQLKVNNYTGKIKWTSSNTSIATVSSTGKVKGKKAGTVTISARAGKKTLKCKVSVRSVIRVSPKKIYLDGTDDATITVKLKHRCGLRYSITSPYVVSCSWDKQWYENNTVAYLYITGERTGTTYVTITNTFNNEKVRIKVVVDTTVKVEGVNISSNSESLYVGDSVKLSADVYPSNATDRGITWYSDNTSVAKVSDYGRVEAVSSGQATITAKSNNGHTASCIITVMTPINVKLPNTPVTIKSYDYGGGLRRACIITNVRFECGIKVSDSYSCRIYIDGKKTYDFGGNTISSPCPVGYKIYRNGAVIKSGVIYSTALGVGESFIDCSGNLFLAPGNYELQLLDVR